MITCTTGKVRNSAVRDLMTWSRKHSVYEASQSRTAYYAKFGLRQLRWKLAIDILKCFCGMGGNVVLHGGIQLLAYLDVNRNE